MGEGGLPELVFLKMPVAHQECKRAFPNHEPAPERTTRVPASGLMNGASDGLASSPLVVKASLGVARVHDEKSRGLFHDPKDVQTVRFTDTATEILQPPSPIRSSHQYTRLRRDFRHDPCARCRWLGSVERLSQDSAHQTSPHPSSTPLAANPPSFATCLCCCGRPMTVNLLGCVKGKARKAKADGSRFRSVLLLKGHARPDSAGGDRDPHHHLQYGVDGGRLPRELGQGVHEGVCISDDLTFHDIRGSAVTRLAAAGCEAPKIATITGHSLKDVEAILDAHYLA